MIFLLIDCITRMLDETKKYWNMRLITVFKNRFPLMFGRLAVDSGLRRSYNRKLRGVVDGQGAMRIAEELCFFCKHSSCNG